MGNGIICPQQLSLTRQSSLSAAESQAAYKQLPQSQFLLLSLLHRLTNTDFYQMSALVYHPPSKAIAAHHNQFQEAKLGHI